MAPTDKASEGPGASARRTIRTFRPVSSPHEALCRRLQGEIERCRASEELLKNSELRFRLLYERLPLAHQSLNAHGEIIEVNPAWLSMLGYEEHQVIGTPFADFLPHRFKKLFKERFPHFKEEGTIHAVPFTILKKDGSGVEVEADGRIDYNSDGTFNQTHCVLRDVTERNKTLRRSQVLLDELRRKNQQLETILSVASHDVRAPLISAAGFAHELELSCRTLRDILTGATDSPSSQDSIRRILEEDIPEAVEFICRSTDKAEELLNGLMKVSRLGLTQMNAERLDMNDLADSIIASVRHNVEAEGVQITVDKLPHCIADRSLIDHVFGNLIDNALKYSHPDRPGRIHISGRTDNDKSIYCVRDNGIGIPESSRSKVFEIFHRLDPGSPIQGQGLGLSIVRRIVERANGAVWVESKVDVGSSFYVALPKT